MQKRYAILLSVLAIIPLGLFATSASAGSHPTYKAVTAITDLSETGPNGDPLDSGPPLEFGSGTIYTWANDDFTRTATVGLKGPAATGHCSPTATTCYSWAGTIKDSGTFTTAAGQLGLFGTTEVTQGQDLTGTFTGGTSAFTFYATTNSASAASVPTTVDAPASGATVTWMEQFFPPGTVFSSDCAATAHSPACTPGTPISCDEDNCPDTLGPWSWTYTLKFGTNTQCPNLAFRWVYNSVDRGTYPPDGSIQTPINTGGTPCEAS